MAQSHQLILVRQRYTPYGGAERFINRALESLCKQGLDISVIARKWDGNSAFQTEKCSPFYIGRLWRDKGFAHAVCQHLQKAPKSVVQSHERIPCCDIYRAGDGVHREWLRQRGRLRGKASRLISTLDPYHHYTLHAEKRLFTSPRLKAVICNSLMVRDELKEWFGLADDMLPVIHNGIDSSTFHPNLRNEFLSATRDKWDIPQEVPLFLFVGSGFERKGLTSCLYALAALKNSDARMLVVGKDRNINSYRKLVQRLGLGPRVTFTGPQSDTRPFYGAADALLLPTLYDPFPNVVLEGMASGLPVITSNKSGSTDIIEQGVNGLYCDALDIDGLTSMMSELLDPTKRMALGNSARITVEPMSLDNMTQQYLDLYSRFFSL